MTFILNFLQGKIFKIGLSIFFFFVVIFARSFMGIYIFGFRIGEFMMLFSVLVLIYSIIFYSKIEILKEYVDQKTYYLLVTIVLSFFPLALLSGSSFSNPYTYRSSTYIWTLGFFLLGIIFFEKNNFNLRYVYLLVASLVFVYLFAIYGLSENITTFILSISDKYEPHKGSDLLLVYISIFFIFNRLVENKRFALEMFILFSAAYFPLMLFKSRASFIGFLVYVIFELIYLRKYFRNGLARNFIVGIASIYLIFQSIFLVSGSGFLKTTQIQTEVEYVVTYRADPDDEVFRLFYIAEDILGSKTTRIFSSDNNLNWRLQIWQDVIYDLSNKNLFFLGYGYKDKIPAMLDEGRMGLDRLNENVHNYLVTVFARGGFTSLILIIILYFYSIKRNIAINKTKYCLIFLIPLIFNSLFDVAMENSHFPLLFYFIFGMTFHKSKIFKNY